ncbi:hypothetical protein OXX79_013300, partial [Metschnikowia pulcherrima]
YKLSCLETEDIKFLEDKKIEIDQREAAGSALLQRNIKFDFVKYESASDDELSQSDEKKAISYKLQGQRLLNNKVIDPLDLYVTHRPRS